jgi:putative membrane protein
LKDIDMKSINLTSVAPVVHTILFLAAGLIWNAARAAEPPPIGNPAGMAPDTPGVYEARPDAEHANTADLIFAHEAALGGMAEVNAGKLASRKAQSKEVMDFANRLVSDHSAAGDRLAALTKGGKGGRPADLDKDHKVMLEQLGKVDARAFDAAYIRGQIVDHQRSAQLYEWIIDNGQDPKLASYAMETLPVVLRHLEMAKALLAQLTGSVP